MANKSKSSRKSRKSVAGRGKVGRPRKSVKKSAKKSVRKSRKVGRPRKSASRKKSVRKSRRVGRPRKSKKTAHKYLSRSEKGLGECRGKKKKVCQSDPNCSYRRHVGCVRRRSKSGSPREVFYGPTRPNAKPY